MIQTHAVRGFVAAACFTLDPYPGAGEYDPPFASVAQSFWRTAEDFLEDLVEVLGAEWSATSLDVDWEAFGRCLFYHAAGHGGGFSDKQWEGLDLDPVKDFCRSHRQEDLSPEDVVEAWAPTEFILCHEDRSWDPAYFNVPMGVDPMDWWNNNQGNTYAYRKVAYAFCIRKEGE